MVGTDGIGGIQSGMVGGVMGKKPFISALGWGWEFLTANGREWTRIFGDECGGRILTTETLRTTDGTEKNLWIGFLQRFWVSRITGLWFVSERLFQAL